VGFRNHKKTWWNRNAIRLERNDKSKKILIFFAVIIVTASFLISVPSGSLFDNGSMDNRTQAKYNN
jgi:hypothetical protein